MKDLAIGAACAVFIICAMASVRLGDRFVEKKIENDSSIAFDTKRAADALEKIAAP